MKVLTLPEVPLKVYEELDYPAEGKCSDVVQISSAEADAYYEAALHCFKRVDEATEYVIEQGMLSSLGVPTYMHKLIEHTYTNYTYHPHMLGRFDFAGGLKNVPIKLIEFNADTPFSIFEVSTVQYALAKAHGLNPDEKQFNTLFEQLVEFFSYLKKQKSHRSILCTNIKHGEDDLNTHILEEACGQVFENTAYRHWTSVSVGADDALCVVEKLDDGLWHTMNFDTIVKMVPWDWLFKEDPSFAKLIANALLAHPNTVVCNPAYAAVYQSKALMATMFQLFPDDPYLLFTHDSKPDNPSIPYVRKPMYGREGENIYLYTGSGTVETAGDYGDGPMVYQEVAQMIQHEGYYYQAGVFVSMEEPCGLGFRRSKSPIIVTHDALCGHIIA